jgi:hypothetical protein
MSPDEGLNASDCRARRDEREIQAEITCHTPCVAYHTSHVKRHASQITRHQSIGQRLSSDYVSIYELTATPSMELHQCARKDGGARVLAIYAHIYTRHNRLAM